METRESISRQLDSLARELAQHPAVLEKARIETAYSPALSVSGGIPVGDDCAAIPDTETGGYLLFAAEGMLTSFVEDDPWFAGYSAVMVNLSDIAAMGGRPIALTNIIWKNDLPAVDLIWKGMQAASQAYNIPIVGGHTTQLGKDENRIHLGAAVLGKAGPRLMTSFDAKPGDRLAIAIDMGGAYRQDKPFWNASTTRSPEQLRRSLDLLAKLAEQGYCQTAKDISNGGIVGTLAMLAHSSEVGVKLDLDALPRPEDDTSWLKWLTSFPSYGYLLAITEDNMQASSNLFKTEEITFADIGVFTKDAGVHIARQNQQARIEF